MEQLCDAAEFHSGMSRGGLYSPDPMDQSRTDETVPSIHDPIADLAARNPPFRCHLCSRSYERADHLNRHLKSHENTRSYRCTTCPKRFNRADLLKRHQASHGGASIPISRKRIVRHDRVASACSACVASKSKCQDEKPCTRCRKKGLACQIGSNDVTNAHFQRPNHLADNQFEIHSDNLGRAPHADSEPPFLNDTIQPSLDTAAKIIAPGDHGSQQYDINGIGFDNVDASQIEGVQFHTQASTSGPNALYYPEARSLVTGDDQYYDSIYNDFHLDSQDNNFNTGALPLLWDFHFNQDVDFHITDIPFDLEDSTSHDIGRSPETTLSNRKYGSGGFEKDHSKRYAAFQRSPWLWRPTQNDQTLNDQQDIAVDEENISVVLTPGTSSGVNIDSFSSSAISSRRRDEILSVLLTMRRGPAKPISFPSLALLNTVIQVYFSQESQKIDQLIHYATFNPSEALANLLIAILSAGSTFISTPAVWKMGLALQEVVRHSVGELFEQNNSNTRNLHALQAFTICLDVGLWSGFKRKMEIAESFGQPIIIMLRRSGIFARSHPSSSAIPSCDDTKSALESKWRKWVELESFKRLILHLFFHDAHASAALQKPPLLMLSELNFSLPFPRNFWLAKSASEWRDLYLAKDFSRNDSLTFMDLLDNPSTFQTAAKSIDVELCALAVLNGYWSQIWGLHESRKFYSERKTTQRLCLLTSINDLYQDLSDLNSNIPSLFGHAPTATVIAELFMMLLHVSPDELQRFAGKYGEIEARRAQVVAKTWAQTTEARTAVWHAGQVFKAAEALVPTHLRDFNAIAVYYASLTLCIYGMMTPSPITAAPSPNPNRQQSDGYPSSSSDKPLSRVILNDTHDGASLKDFKAAGVKYAGIASASGEIVPLEFTDQVLDVARQIYRRNFPGVDGLLPPLVENLGNLLKDLSSSPGSRMSRAASPRP